LHPERLEFDELQLNNFTARINAGEVSAHVGSKRTFPKEKDGIVLGLDWNIVTGYGCFRLASSFFLSQPQPGPC
jgi:hypothetical protein